MYDLKIIIVARIICLKFRDTRDDRISSSFSTSLSEDEETAVSQYSEKK